MSKSFLISITLLLNVVFGFRFRSEKKNRQLYNLQDHAALVTPTVAVAAAVYKGQTTVTLDKTRSRQVKHFKRIVEEEQPIVAKDVQSSEILIPVTLKQTKSALNEASSSKKQQHATTILIPVNLN